MDKIKLPVILINLDRSQDRLEKVKEQFDKYQVKWERISAIDGRVIGIDDSFTMDPSVAENLGVKFKHITKPQQPGGVIACTLSHAKAIKRAYDLGYQAAVIMEDDTDMSLMSEWSDHNSYDQIITRAPSDWEIIQMYVSNEKVVPELYNKETADRFYHRNCSCWSTGTYIICRRGMEKFLSKQYLPKDDMFILYGDLAADTSIYHLMQVYIYSTPTVCTYDRFFNSVIWDRDENHGKMTSSYIYQYYHKVE